MRCADEASGCKAGSKRHRRGKRWAELAHAPGSLIDKNTSVMTDKELDSVAKAVADRLGVNSKEVLTAREACRYMGVTYGYLGKLTMRRAVPFSKPMGKYRFFRRADLEEWLMSNRVATGEELDAQAAAYTRRKGGAA